jgi:hypothetical protein
MSKPARRKAIRNIPAYQEYASDVLASLNWRMMNLAERGLWDTLRKECWVNGSIPSDPTKLAALLNKPVIEIMNGLTALVKSEFLENDGKLTCRELDLYKADILDQRKLQSEGGSLGGRTTQANIRKKIQSVDRDHSSKEDQGNLKVLSRGELIRNEQNCNELSSNEELTSDLKNWLDSYDNEK